VWTSITSNLKSESSIDAYSLRKIPAKFHPDPIWNDEALRFFKDGRPNRNKNNKNE